jgi:CheY-like chemotaxis protein
MSDKSRTANQFNYNVLYIGKSLPDVDNIADMLSEYAPSIQVTHVPTLAEGKQYFQKDGTDVILLDIEEINDDRQDHFFWPPLLTGADDIPIVLLADSASEQQALHFLSQGAAQDYLINSRLTPDGLARALRKVIERQKQRVPLSPTTKADITAILAGGIAHDFNNMLGVILGNVELAIDDAPEYDEAMLLSLKEIRKAGHRAKSMVSQLLNFTRNMADDRKYPANIVPLIKEALRLMNTTLPSNIFVQQNINSHTAMILTAPDLIYKALINLCDNAIDGMSDNGGTMTVTLEHCCLKQPLAAGNKKLPEGDYIQLCVHDSGEVFPPETFNSSSDVAARLQVVEDIVHDHNGGIVLDDTFDRGNCIRVYLPAATSDVVADTQPVDSLPTGTETILFVDDDVSIGNLIKPMLERLGYRVIVYNDSLQALDAFLDDPVSIDLLLTDLAMPGITGTELARRAIQKKPELPVVLCTGYLNSLRSSGATTEQDGISAILSKPVSITDLAAILRTALDTHRTKAH